jgi:hypothetical protein
MPKAAISELVDPRCAKRSRDVAVGQVLRASSLDEPDIIQVVSIGRIVIVVIDIVVIAGP